MRSKEGGAILRDLRRDYLEAKERAEYYCKRRDDHPLYQELFDKASNLALLLGHELEKRNWLQEESDAEWEANPRQP